MTGIEQAVDEIKKMFWGVLKGQYGADEEEDVKARLITALATLSAFAKSFLPEEQQKEYEEQFSQSRDILLRFDSAGPWFREMPELVETVYNVLTYANVLQIEAQRYSNINNDALQYYNIKLETIESKLSSIQNRLNKIEEYIQKISKKEKMTLVNETNIYKHTEFNDSKPLTTVEEKEEPLTVIEEPLTTVEEKEEPLTVIEEPLTTVEEKEETQPDVSLPIEDEEIIEGLKISSQYELEQEPIKESLEFEKESLQKLANLLQALDPGDDLVLSPLTKKLLSLGSEEGKISAERGVSDASTITIEEDTKITQEINKGDITTTRSSVDKLSDILSSTDSETSPAQFINAVRETIKKVTEQTSESSTVSPLTKIIEAETGLIDDNPVKISDIEKIIEHLETKKQSAVERVRKLEKIIAEEQVDETEWQDLMINAQQHLLRIEDTLDGYKRVLTKLKSKIEN